MKQLQEGTNQQSHFWNHTTDFPTEVQNLKNWEPYGWKSTLHNNTSIAWLQALGFFQMVFLDTIILIINSISFYSFSLQHTLLAFSSPYFFFSLNFPTLYFFLYCSLPHLSLGSVALYIVHYTPQTIYILSLSEYT